MAGFFSAAAVAGGSGSRSPGRAPRQKGGGRRQQEEGKFRQPGYRRQRQHDPEAINKAAAGKQLPSHVDREGGVGGGAGDHHAARHRDQQRWDHGDQAIADGEHGVGLQRFAERNIELEDADQESGDDVDGGNQDGGDGVALVEAGGAVHGAVEFRVARDLLAPGAGLRLVDQAGVQVGVDGHLLAGHGVEGEAGGNLGGAHRAVR